MAPEQRAETLTDHGSAAPRTGMPPDRMQTWLVAASQAADAKRARLENFPVASRVLPPQVRADLFAVYGVARLIDEAGDAYPGGPEDRLATLDAIAADLRRLPTGTAEIPAVRQLAPAVARGLAVCAFHDLIEANRRDQLITRYPTFTDLREYCRYSADPIGRLVLSVLRLSTDDRLALSDDICTALQIAEHLQDVGEDLRCAGRIYLPQESLSRFDVREDLLGALADPAAARAVPGTDRARVSALLAAEAGRARDLLVRGAPLIGLVPGRARFAIAGFVAGGHAALDAVTVAGAAAVTSSPRPRPARVLRHALTGLLSGGKR